MPNKGGYRSYVDVETIPTTNTKAVSNGLCAGLVMHFTRVGKAANWKQGAAVRGNATIKKGTAIATFVNGVYPNAEHGNHAALYVSQESDRIWVIDQWEDQPPHKRYLLFKGQNADGTYIDPSNNGDAFSIIEL